MESREEFVRSEDPGRLTGVSLQVVRVQIRPEIQNQTENEQSTEIADVSDNAF